MITGAFESSRGSASAARSIYLALSEIASDKQADMFTVSQAEIAGRAGLSTPTVKRILPTLRQLGFVAIRRNYMNRVETQSTYTLIRGPLAHGEPAPDQRTTSERSTEKECFEESQKKKHSHFVEELKSGGFTKQKGTQREIEEFCISIGLPKSDGELVFLKWNGNGWTNRGNPIIDWKSTLRSWKGSGFMPSQQSLKRCKKHGAIRPIRQRIDYDNLTQEQIL